MFRNSFNLLVLITDEHGFLGCINPCIIILHVYVLFISTDVIMHVLPNNYYCISTSLFMDDGVLHNYDTFKLPIHYLASLQSPDARSYIVLTLSPCTSTCVIASINFTKCTSYHLPSDMLILYIYKLNFFLRPHAYYLFPLPQAPPVAKRSSVPSSLAHIVCEPLSSPPMSVLWSRASLSLFQVETPALPISLTVELQSKAALPGWSSVGLVLEMVQDLPLSAKLTADKTGLVSARLMGIIVLYILN